MRTYRFNRLVRHSGRSGSYLEGQYETDADAIAAVPHLLPTDTEVLVTRNHFRGKYKLVKLVSQEVTS